MDNTKLANEDDDSDDSNIFKKKKKKSSEDYDSRKNSNYSNDSNSGNNSEENELIFYKQNKTKQNDKNNKDDENLENIETDNKLINKETSDNLVGIKDDLESKISNELNKQEENENNILKDNYTKVKSLLKKNKEDELNLADDPEKNSSKNAEENIDLHLNLEDKTKEVKKVNFSPQTEDYNNNIQQGELRSKGIKKSFHQKKNNIDNIAINMEKLILENKQNQNEENNENSEEINSENGNEEISNNEVDGQEFIDLSNEKIKDNSSSDLNNTIKSELANYTYPNLDHLFEFLVERKDLNYVLAGYFYKIFNHLLNDKNISLIKYIFKQNSSILDNFINNVQRKSICDCLTKLLVLQLDENIIPDGLQIKNEVLEKLFLKMRDMDIEGLTNVSEMIVECLKNKHFYINFISESKIFEIINDLLINTNDLNHQINILKDDDDFPKVNKSEIYKCLLKILNKLNENILKDFGTSLVTPSFNDDTETNIFSFQSINLDTGLNSMNDDELGVKKIDPLDIKIKLEKIYNILCQISYTIIEEYINSEKNEKDYKTIITTYDENKKILGTKRYLDIIYQDIF